MISRTFFSPVEATVPPVPLTWKKSGSLNSQASVVCATNSVSIDLYSRRSPCTTQKKKVLASLRSRSDMLPETSSMKNTTACTAGWRRRASWRKRRSSSVKVGVAPGEDLRFSILACDLWQAREGVESEESHPGHTNPIPGFLGGPKCIAPVE